MDSGSQDHCTGKATMLSFICTVKNGERYLDECIGSVVMNHPDAEFVIVDDGSSDETPAILRRWARDAPQVRIVSQGAIGRGAALNLAVSACRTPYIANIDADDIVLPGRSVLVEYLERLGPEVAVAAGESVLLFGESGYEMEQQKVREVDPEKFQFQNVGRKIYRGNPLSHISVVMRREAIMAVGGYNASRRSQLDYDLWVRLVVNGFELHRASVPLSVKRLHDAQSFEHGDHLRFVLRSLPVRFTAAQTALQMLEASLVAVPQVIWAAVPRPIRLGLMAMPFVRETGRWLREGKS